DEDLMFDTGVLDGDEVVVETGELVVNAATTTKSISVSVVDPVTNAGEVVTNASVEIPDELTLAQTLIEIKTAKPKAITTAATTVAPAKDKGKAKMNEPKIPLKKKDQIAFNKEVARRLEAEIQVELEEEERVAKLREEEANLISWDNTQAMIEADFELA
ncbi:hypothetical protein Tco_0062803, partial [Tanacetum coccineum]